jgi:hypothetical protein
MNNPDLYYGQLLNFVEVLSSSLMEDLYLSLLNFHGEIEKVIYSLRFFLV